MRAPFGCTIRYDATTISVVARSSFLNSNLAGSIPLITPLSNTYNRTDFGGLGGVWAAAGPANRTGRIIVKNLRRGMATSISPRFAQGSKTWAFCVILAPNTVANPGTLAAGVTQQGHGRLRGQRLGDDER